MEATPNPNAVKPSEPAEPIFDDLQRLQHSLKMENELSQMFGKLFEEQITSTTTDLNKNYI